MPAITYAPHGTRWVTSALIYLLIVAVAGVVYYFLYIAGQEEHLGKRALRSLSYVGVGISRSLETLKTSADTATEALSRRLLSQRQAYRDMGGAQEAILKLQELAKQAKLNPRYRHLEADVPKNCDLAATLEKTGDVWKFAICGDKDPANKGLADKVLPIKVLPIKVLPFDSKYRLRIPSMKWIRTHWKTSTKCLWRPPAGRS